MKHYILTLLSDYKAGLKHSNSVSQGGKGNGGAVERMQGLRV